ncbi:LamG-like jellyroll fold domain-containing protein [Planctomycetota bacterium]
MLTGLVVLLIGSYQVVSADLVAHWPLNEGAGDVFEDVVGDHDGFLPIAEFEEQAEVDWGQGPPTQENAVEFLGINSFIATDFPGIEADNPRTVSFWFKTEGGDPYFLGWGANASSEKWHVRLNGTAGVMRTEFQGGQNFATTDLIDGEWHHVASVFPEGATEGEEILHYVDGVLDEQAGGTSLPIDTAIAEDEVDWTVADSFDPYPVHFGAVMAHGFGRMLEGSMADVRIYDEGLSEDRILAIMDGSDQGGLNTNPCDFDGDGLLGIADVNLLTAEIQAGTNAEKFDLNDDGSVDSRDLKQFVEGPDKLNTYVGDANLDGEFNSSDFVVVFTASEYEDTIASNSTWATGDWNGDGEFNSSDFVTAFTSAGYEQGPRTPAVVPEPSATLLSLLGVLAIAVFRGSTNPID